MEKNGLKMHVSEVYGRKFFQNLSEKVVRFLCVCPNKLSENPQNPLSEKFVQKIDFSDKPFRTNFSDSHFLDKTRFRTLFLDNFFGQYLHPPSDISVTGPFFSISYKSRQQTMEIEGLIDVFNSQISIESEHSLFYVQLNT